MFNGFEITTWGKGENSTVPLARHNAACSYDGMPPAGPDDWTGVILADHGLVAAFSTQELADQFLEVALFMEVSDGAIR